MDELERRRRLAALGQRAVDYYVECGLCVFCDADDVAGRPHDSDCDVGLVAGVPLTPERVQEKREERRLVNLAVLNAIAKQEELLPPGTHVMTKGCRDRYGGSCPCPDDRCWVDYARAEHRAGRAAMMTASWLASGAPPESSPPNGSPVRKRKRKGK